MLAENAVDIAGQEDAFLQAALAHDKHVAHEASVYNRAGAGEGAGPQVELVDGAARVERVQEKARVAQLVELRGPPGFGEKLAYHLVACGLDDARGDSRLAGCLHNRRDALDGGGVHGHLVGETAAQRALAVRSDTFGELAVAADPARRDVAGPWRGPLPRARDGARYDAYGLAQEPAAGDGVVDDGRLGCGCASHMRAPPRTWGTGRPLRGSTPDRRPRRARLRRRSADRRFAHRWEAPSRRRSSRDRRRRAGRSG